MNSKRVAAAMVCIGYLAAGGICFGDLAHPWGAPKPEARWAKIVPRDDPRPFWTRLLLSLRYDFSNRDIRGGVEF